jgi:hypothetical protein
MEERRMTVRLIFGTAWSLVTGLAGGWLLLSPWALATQGAGGWTAATRSTEAAGAGIVVLAVAGIVAVTWQTVAALRAAGATGGARSRAAAAAPPEMEQALIALAQALAEDLAVQRPAEPVEEAADAAAWSERR